MKVPDGRNSWKTWDKVLDARSIAETSKQMEKDLKVAGELIPDDQLSKFCKKFMNIDI